MCTMFIFSTGAMGGFLCVIYRVAVDCLDTTGATCSQIVWFDLSFGTLVCVLPLIYDGYTI